MAIGNGPKSNTLEQKEKINLRILVAEDDPALRMLLGYILSPKYSSVEFVENGKLLVDKLSALGEHYDFIITDHNMPEMKGLDAIKKIREMEHLKTIPIILATTDGSLKGEAESFGTVFLSKPLDKEKLYTTIERMRVPEK